MPKRTPGSLNAPPPQAEFDRLPLARMTARVAGVFHRLHTLNPATGQPWGALHFSCRGMTRFDPAAGAGALYLAATLAGGLAELFNDLWGPVGTLSRSLRLSTDLQNSRVTAVDLPAVELFDATGPNLSKVGTDAQLLTGDYPITREWALRLMQHPDGIGGILYRSRHDPGSLNVALFGRPGLLPGRFDPGLDPAGTTAGWRRTPGHGSVLVHGPAVVLGAHPELPGALRELEVAVLP